MKKFRKSMITAVLLACVCVAGGCSSSDSGKDSAKTEDKKTEDKKTDVSVDLEKLDIGDKALQGNIKAIANVHKIWSSEQLQAFILDYDHNVYMKTNNKVIKLEGTTELNGIKQIENAPESNMNFLISDGEHTYHIDGENKKIETYEHNDKISSFVKINEESRFWALDKNKQAKVFRRCDVYKDSYDNDCKNDNDWFAIDSEFGKDIQYAGGDVVLKDNNLYKNSIITAEEAFHGQDLSTALIESNVEAVWAADYLQNLGYDIYTTKDNKTYFFFNNTKVEVPLNEKARDAYHVDGSLYVDFVIVGDSKVFTVGKDPDSYEPGAFKAEELTDVSKYAKDIKGAYYEDNKLYGLFSDGNCYVLKDFSNVY